MILFARALHKPSVSPPTFCRFVTMKQMHPNFFFQRLRFVLPILFLSLAAAAAWANPIEIATIDDLQKIGNHPDFPFSGNYVLTDDIDAAATEDFNEGAGFYPIGGPSDPFTGTFDGRGHVISHLHINRLGLNNVALFGVISAGGEVHTVGLEGAEVTGNVFVGGLVGFVNPFGNIWSPYVTGMVTLNAGVGGVVGFLHSDATLSNAYATSSVSGDFRTGDTTPGPQRWPTAHHGAAADQEHEQERSHCPNRHFTAYFVE